MDPITLSALISAGSGLVNGAFKFFQGNKQVKDAKALAASNKFTPFQTPNQVYDITRLAEQNYRNGMPGVDRAKNQIGTNEASALQAATQGASSAGDLIDAATRINLGANQASNNLAGQEANYKANALGGYQAALGTEAQYKDKEYQINYLDPYIRKANTAASMYGAGQINKANAFDTAGTAALASAQLLAGTGNGGNKPNNMVANPLLLQQQFKPNTYNVMSNPTPSFGFPASQPDIDFRGYDFKPSYMDSPIGGLNTSSIAAASMRRNGSYYS